MHCLLSVIVIVHLSPLPVALTLMLVCVTGLPVAFVFPAIVHRARSRERSRARHPFYHAFVFSSPTRRLNSHTYSCAGWLWLTRFCNGESCHCALDRSPSVGCPKSLSMPLCFLHHISLCPRQGSNPHCRPFKGLPLTNWATGTSAARLHHLGCRQVLQVDCNPTCGPSD